MKSKVLDELIQAQRKIARRLGSTRVVSDEEMGRELLEHYSHCPMGCGATIGDARALVLTAADRKDFLGRYGGWIANHIRTHPECFAKFEIEKMEYVNPVDD
jgi:hypothetical protein